MSISITDNKAGTMRNTKFDAWFIMFPLLLAAIAAIYLKAYPQHTYWAVAAVFWLTSNTHGILTYMKAMWNKSNRKKYYHFVTWVPILLLILCGLIWSWYGAAMLISIYFYTQLFHYVRQSYGLSMVYKRTSSHSPPDWLHKGALYMFPLWGLLINMSEGFIFFKNEIHTFDIGEVSLQIIATITICLCGLWLFDQLNKIRKKNFSLSYFSYMASHFIVFYIGLFCFENQTQGWVCMAYWHGVQYIMFVWNNFQLKSKEKSEGELEVLKYISQNIYILSIAAFLSGGIILFGLKLIFSSTIIWAVPLFFIITLMLNFNHYLIDALIWRRPKLQK